MKTHPLTSKNWLYVALGSILIGILFAWPFLSVITLAILMAFLFNGVYNKLLNRFKPMSSALLTLSWSFLILVVPIGLILIFTFLQLTHLAASLTETFTASGSTMPATIQSAINWVNTTLGPVVGTTPVVSGEGITAFLKTALPQLVAGLTAFITGFLGGIPVTIVLVLIYTFLFIECLVYGKKITATVIALSPFQPDITRMYLARTGIMANAMAKGQLLISFIIAILSAGILAICLGMSDYFFLMVVVFTVLNLVPLGCGIIVIPITIGAMVFGNFWGGLIAFVLYMIAANLDNAIRPMIIPKSVNLTAGLTALSAFGGVVMFGLIGVVYGPIIMILIVTSIQMYMDYYDKEPKWRKKANRSTT